MNVVPLAPGNGGGSVSLPSLSGPQPVSATVLQGSGVTFTYTGSVNSNGSGASPWSLSFQDTAAGNDGNSGKPVSSGNVFSNSIGVSQPAQLSASFSVTPLASTVGQIVTVVLTVSNSGDATAQGVQPSSVIQNGTGGLQLLTGAVQTPIDVAKGASTTFMWTYSALGVGTLTLSANASGIDQNSGLVVNSPIAISALETVQFPASLLVQSVTASPASIGTGGLLLR